MFSPYDYYITDEEYAEAARNGISYDRLTNRIRRNGWGKKEAMTTPVKVHKEKASFIRLAKENGICYETFKARVYSRGWDEYAAATTPLRDNKWIRENALRSSEKNRRYPREILELAKKNGICYNTFYYRVKTLKWDLEEAATKPASFLNGVNKCKELYGKDFCKNQIKLILGQAKYWRRVPYGR